MNNNDINLKEISNILDLSKEQIKTRGQHLSDFNKNGFPSKKNEDWSYYAFPLILNKRHKIERNKLVNYLKKKNIGTSVYYPHPLPRLSYFKKKYKINLGNFLNAKKFSDQTIMLPIGPHINQKKIFLITKEIFSFIRENK